MNRETKLDETTLAELRRRLCDARHQVLTELGVSEEDLQRIEEDRQIELEDRAQQEAAFDVLARLETHAYDRIHAVQDALDRIADGSYGSCEGCGEAIALERLRAMPETTYCHDCAEQDEDNRRRRAAAAEE